MSGADSVSSAERQGKVIGRLVEQYQSVEEPDKWLQAVTLRALRALDKAGLQPADRIPARREIHAIHREVASKAKAALLTRRVLEETAQSFARPPQPAAPMAGGGAGAGMLMAPPSPPRRAE